MRLAALRACAVLFSSQDHLRRILLQPTSPQPDASRASAQSESSSTEDEAGDGHSSKLLLQKLMTSATQSSPIKTTFAKEELEVRLCSVLFSVGTCVVHACVVFSQAAAIALCQNLISGSRNPTISPQKAHTSASNTQNTDANTVASAMQTGAAVAAAKLVGEVRPEEQPMAAAVAEGNARPFFKSSIGKPSCTISWTLK